LISNYVSYHDVVWLGFKTGISYNGSTPLISIISPENNTINSNHIAVEIQAMDVETSDEDLVVWINVERNGVPDPPHPFYAVYDQVDSVFRVSIDISKYKDNSRLIIKAFAEDEANNIGISKPVVCWVGSNITYDQWIHTGWNLILLPSISGNNSIENVFSSIWNDFEIIYEIGTGKNYISGEGGNTLKYILPSTWYEVKMINPERFYH
jgi:hypothetical protein